MMVFRPGDRLAVTAGEQGARLMLLGGETLGGPRYIWWNFVASSKEQIEAAKEAWRAGDWAHGRFQLPPGDDARVHPGAGVTRTDTGGAAGALTPGRRTPPAGCRGA